jgi:arsenate reductase
MAEGFFKHYARERALNIDVQSAGTRPAGYVHSLAIQVMSEKGIDISRQESKGIQPERFREFDYIISMGCSDKEICPAHFRGVNRDWGIADPFGQSLEFYRKARDEIEQRVLTLLEELSHV